MGEAEARVQEAEILDRPLVHPEGFTLQIKYSSIDHPSAGFGVFVTQGQIVPGTVLGLYPGTIITPESFKMLNKESEYMMTGYDGIVVDAYGWSESAIALRRKLRLHQRVR